MTDTKEKILAVALQLFAKDGYEAVSVSKIAEKLGITKGALYKHYENKKDIKINLENTKECEAELALSFARRFKTLSVEQVNELQKILDE